MPKVPYTNNILSKANNPLPFPNYLNTLSLLTDTSISTVRNFFNANKSFSEALLITIISVIQEGIAYQIVNHSGTNYSNNSKSYTNNTNYYCCKGVPIKPQKSSLKKRSNSFSYGSTYSSNLDDDNGESQTYIIKCDERNPEKKKNGFNNSLKNSKLSRSFSSSKLYTKISSNEFNKFDKKINSKTNPKVYHSSNLKHCITQDFQDTSQNSDVVENSSKKQPKNKNNEQIDDTSRSCSPTINLSNPSKIVHDKDSVDSEFSFKETKKSKISVFILLKNLLSILDIFKNLGCSSSSNHHHHQKPIKPFDSIESLDDKEKWKEFNRIYNEIMYNLKTEEYYKSKSQIFKYSTGLNSLQGCYFDLEDNSDDADNSAINSLSILDEKIREKSEIKIIDILSRIKKDTLTFAEIKECGEYMRRVGIYQLFIQCPINHLLRVIASKLFSCGEKKYSPILRFLFVTCVISPIQISMNILCLALSNKKTPSEIKKSFSNNFSHILKLSLIYVPFSTQYFARTFLPRHLWVPFFNLSSFILGTYIKVIMKKKDDRKLINF
ncbi:hypothetical protein LY90DRAFT_670867 [Neocallimastix californiae]|uniref:Uncharacterized protein n=1 Tax=Neocallimastix californiae TaxID=1754190 RepID=A0A1Y2CRS5_9FUNG|nr:hypothetical protein LY90DRAFT_670867 [Neocallimastix californiae]|eukprot:ORY49712.1 hypothetical protein LY90DRAFT_670867 [Neocallimastix californiae]